MNQSRHLEKLEHFKAYNPTAAQLRIASEREVEEADTLTRRQRVVCLVCCLIAAGYSIQGDHGLLFGMALVTFTCGFTVMWTYRHHIPGYVPATMY